MPSLSSLRAAGVVLVVATLAACAPVEDDAEPTGEARQALSTDSWQGVYALRASGTSYILNPLGNAKVSCATSVFVTSTPQSECAFGRVNFASLGLSAARRQQVVTRLQTEPAEESRVSVIVKGQFVSRTTPVPGQREFQVLAAWMAPSVRTHGAAIYYASALSSPWFLLRPVNTELTGLVGLNLQARFVWAGPAAEQPVFTADNFVAVAGVRSLGTSGAFGPFEARVDQYFTRVRD